jgi:predicted dehydrogenase
MELLPRIEGLRYVEVTVLHPEDSDYHMHHAMLPPKSRPQGALAPADEAADIRSIHTALASGPMSALMDEVCGAGASGARRLAAKILTESLIHDLNLVRAALGEPERVLSANVWNGGLAQQSLVQFAKGVHANLSWVAVPGLKNYDERVRFVGPRMRAQVRFPSPYLRHTPAPFTVERMDGEHLVVEERTISHDDSFRLELHHFAQCVRTGAVPETHLDDALGDARFIQMLARAYAPTT